MTESKLSSNNFTEKAVTFKPIKKPSEEVSYAKVEFTKDVLPYFLPCLAFLAQHAIYYYADGNLMWALFLSYLINFPYYKFTAK
jgi:hypothetical protein